MCRSDYRKGDETDSRSPYFDPTDYYCNACDNVIDYEDIETEKENYDYGFCPLCGARIYYD